MPVSVRFLPSVVLAAIVTAGCPSLVAQTTAQHGKRMPRLVIRNALVIDGTGLPASGPYDILIENNRITKMIPIADAVASVIGTQGPRPTGDVIIDAAGKYVLPGFINAHAHVQDERGDIPMPQDYELKVLYPTGTTAVRDGKTVLTGWIEWTIKDGIPSHGPTLLKEVKEIVARARAKR